MHAPARSDAPPRELLRPPFGARENAATSHAPTSDARHIAPGSRRREVVRAADAVRPQPPPSRRVPAIARSIDRLTAAARRIAGPVRRSLIAANGLVELARGEFAQG